MLSTQRAVVRFLDGTTKETTLTQWSIGQWAIFCARQKIPFDMADPGLLILPMLRYQAWAEIHRAQGSNGSLVPTFDIWDMTVEEVSTPEESEPVFPTQTAPSVASSAT